MVILTPAKLAEILARVLEGAYDFETATPLTVTLDAADPATVVLIADPDYGPTSRFALTIKEF